MPNMCNHHGDDPYAGFMQELLDAKLLISSGVKGVYGRSGTFESIIEGFDNLVTAAGADKQPEVIRFPPIFNRKHYLDNDHIETMPDLLGSVHSYMGDERTHRKMLEKVHANDPEWTDFLEATEVMMAPAACYPLYPTVTGTLPEGGRLFDLQSFVFRHEPSDDPSRMQIFRMHEYVRIGSPEEAIEHRAYWLEKGQQILRSVGLDVEAEVANDPFFGRGGKVMKASQKEQELKFELVYPICREDKPTAIASCNCHLDHFGLTYDIRQANGDVAHSSCVGFGLERIALALLKTHGINSAEWPAEIKHILNIV